MPRPHEQGVLVLHIGPFKTGTTSVQRQLWQLARSHAAGGIVYPTRRRSFNQATETLGPILATPPPNSSSHLVPEYVHGLWCSRSDRFDADWLGLVRTAHDTSAPVVISSENLALARADAAQRIKADFRGKRLRIVATARPVSSWLPSWYQQLAKAQRVPPFETFVREALDELVHPNGDDIPRWMDIGWLRSVWEGVDCDGEDIQFQVVPVDVRDPLRILRSLLTSAGIRDIRDAGLDRSTENSRIPMMDLIAWQEYLTRGAPTAMWPRSMLWEKFSAVMNGDLRDLRGLVSQPLALTDEAARLVDSVLPVESGKGEAVVTGDDAARLRSLPRLTRVMDPVDPETLNAIHRTVASRLRFTRWWTTLAHAQGHEAVSVVRKVRAGVRGRRVTG